MASLADSAPPSDAKAAQDSDAKPTEQSRAQASQPSQPSQPSQSPQTPQTPREPVALSTTEQAASPKPLETPADEDEKEEGEADDDDAADNDGKPATSSISQTVETQPPLPAEPVPEQHQPQQDDGWDFVWHGGVQQYYFINRYTGESTWENPRVAASSAAANATSAAANVTSGATAGPQAPAPPPLSTVAGGYHPAIHGDYDKWYAENGPKEDEDDNQTAPAVAAGLADPTQLLASGAAFNRAAGQGADWHSDEARSRRQMNGFFDVDAAANAHDGRSLKAERAGKRLSKGELKHFREKRKARREEKKRAWLRD